MALPDVARPFAKYWGVAVAAVRDKVDTRGFWQALRETSEKTGVPLPPNSFAAVTQLRSAAARQRAAESAFATAPASQVITPELAPTAIWSRDLEQMELMPKLSATAEVTTVDVNGDTRVRYLTVSDIAFRPYMTVGDVRDALQAGVEDLVSRYGYGSVESVSSPSVVAY